MSMETAPDLSPTSMRSATKPKRLSSQRRAHRSADILSHVNCRTLAGRRTRELVLHYQALLGNPTGLDIQMRIPRPTPLSLARLLPPWCQFSLTVLGTATAKVEVRSVWLKIFARRAHPRAACRQEVAAYARDARLRATPPGVRFNPAPSSRRSCCAASVRRCP
jgi:hypothetical protein